MEFTGLSKAEVEESRKKFGDNVIPDSEPTTFWDEFKETFNDPMIRILLVIVAIMLVMYALGQAEIYEPVGTIFAVLIVAFVTAKTGVASDTKYRELKSSIKKDVVKVYRDGVLAQVEIDDIVVGDKVLLQAGDKIPADGIIIHGNLKVNNSALNGEVEECPKSPAEEKIEFPENLTGNDITGKHILFRGAVVFDGEAVLDVHKVGVETLMGKMASEMNEADVDSPLKVKLSKLADQISRFGYASAVLIVVLYMAFFIVQAGGVSAYLAQGWLAILNNVITAVSLAILIVVCAVPEGLPLMISLVLMQNTGKMLAHNVLVRKAIGIETAGSLNILFSDKTGTITKGQLEVVEFLSADGKVIEPSNLGNYSEIRRLLDIAIGKNSASQFDSNHNVIGGNATDQSLMRFLGEENYHSLENKYTVSEKQGFNSTNKFSQAFIKEENKVFYKGAPERLMASGNLKGIDTTGKTITVDTDLINDKINDYASRAMRIIAFSYSGSAMTESKINADSTIIGFVAIRDDVQKEARDAIKDVQDAGIQVVMITGDRKETAVAIAKDAGLIRAETDRVLDSSELTTMTDDEIKAIIRNIRVISRALPTDKSRMVRLCQELNLVVGMTGDGVNDSPALKRADVGFAMGSGTEAAKEAGEIVILDDNFRSIKDAVLYGRTIYHNILKFCRFQLMINVAAVVVSAISPFFGIIEPLKVTHLLFVNLVMDSLGALMLGNEPAHLDYMKEPPRRRDESIISRSMASQILFMALWLVILSFCYLKLPVFASFFNSQEELYTSYFALFIFAALMNGFNVRSTGFDILKGIGDNIGFVKIWLVIALVVAAIVNAELIGLTAISKMFSCTPFGVTGWILLIALSFTMIPMDLIRKAVSKKE
ncbi:MAG: calcium-translocating P-type ATPase, PMCA-type [Selenomonadaceae bacterium]|nr:calcium-translocating P-type ATPase, PMCA-type [Selenomonadaceae bacterium]